MLYLQQESAMEKLESENMVTRVRNTDRRGRPLVLVRLQKRAVLRKQYIAHLHWWRRPIVGYVFSVPFVGLAMLGVLAAQNFLPHFYFPGTFMLLTVLLVALFWGVGPALFTVLLASVTFYYFYASPAWQFNLTNWNGMLQILPFFLSGVFIAIITGQRESARLHALLAEEEAQEHADELENVNAELLQTNQLQDQFLSMASHELKTPITTIRGQAQIALRRLSQQRDLPSELPNLSISLEKIDAQTHRLSTLVDDLLDLSSVRSGKIPLRLGDCDLGVVCRSVVEDQRLLTGRTIELEIPTEPITLRADSDRLSQVLANLLSNAIKYSPENTPVHIRISQGNGMALIQVSDAGSGIPKNLQAHIFEPFYRTPSAQKSASNGFGLGLAICKNIVERHDGRIWCESQKGKGSTFFVELPLSK
jgi:signal transduction histidine kinase